MIALDEDALICDLAETYGILDYRSLPAVTVATLSVGLRADSRIKMKKSGAKIPANTALLAGILDKVNFLAWARTTDGAKNINRPFSILQKIIGDDKPSESEVISFSSPNEFDKARQMLLNERR